MIGAALLALRQAFSPPFRSILLKTVGLALLLLILIGVVLQTAAARLVALENTTWDFLAALLSGAGIAVRSRRRSRSSPGSMTFAPRRLRDVT